MNEIRNLPANAAQYKYIVYTNVNGEKWFYGEYNKTEGAMANALRESPYRDYIINKDLTE